LQPTTSTIECEENQVEKLERNKRETISFLGVRALTSNPIPACEKIDQIFGSGGEVIIHHMWFEQGKYLFEQMFKNSLEKTKQELLNQLIDDCPQMGWGITKITIDSKDLPAVEITVKNPPVKTLKGSQKHLIGSFWAGILSEYFERQLMPKNFNYNSETDEFSCLITS
jgi:hypothetical protein